MPPREGQELDLHTAITMADSFSHTSGVDCRVYDGNGCLLHQRQGAELCARCRAYDATLHVNNARQAERFGGRYIYFCPLGLAFFSSPIMMGGSMVGALVGGPVLISEREDELDSDFSDTARRAGLEEDCFRKMLEEIPRMEPGKLNHLSYQLFAGAVCTSDSSQQLFLAQRVNVQQNTIGEYIQQLKSEGKTPAYPVAREQELTAAISQGDKAAANRLLNEILGYLFFSTPGGEEVRSRVVELLVVISRGAMYGGADSRQIFAVTHKYMQELDWLSSREEIALWLARILNSFTELVFDLVETKHKDVIYRAVDYMKRRFGEKLTLDQVADYVGYSPAYFSRVFKEEMGCTFRAYLNELRVEKSKALLLKGVPISQIWPQVGFEDQSYFGKVFKKVVGVPPDKFRKSRRRIDVEKEYGL